MDSNINYNYILLTDSLKFRNSLFYEIIIYIYIYILNFDFFIIKTKLAKSFP